jgi:hypothetical protein
MAEHVMNPVVMLAVFATPIVGGAILGACSWWWPRRQLAKAFATARRERIAVQRLPAVPVPLPELAPLRRV